MSSRAVSKASTWAACLLVGLGVGIGACSSSHPPARSVQAIHVYGSARNRIRIAPSFAHNRSAIAPADAARLMNRPVIAALETRHRVLFGLARVSITGPFRLGDLNIPVVSPAPNPYTNRLGWVAVYVSEFRPHTACPASKSRHYAATVIDPSTGVAADWTEPVPPECRYATSLGPPTVICGQELIGRSPGPVVYNISHQQSVDASPAPATIDSYSVGNAVYLRVADGCVQGSDVEVVPNDAYAIGAVAQALDGKLAAVQLCPRRDVRARVAASRNGTLYGMVEVDLTPHGGPPPSLPTGCDGQ